MAQGVKIEVKTGEKYNMLTVIHDADVFIKGRRCVLCRCDCGEVKSITISNLVNGSTKSCGCVRRDAKIKKVEEYYNPLWD